MRHLFFVLALFVSFVASAQKNFQPGYIVSLKGDTTSGFIDYKEWDFSPTGILFKPGVNALENEFTVNEIAYFKINENEAYRRSVVNVSLHPAKINDIGGRDTSWKIDTVFLKVVHSGKAISLFSYADIIKERFYILEEGQKEPTELIMREYVKDGSMSLVTEDLYRGQLRGVMYSKRIYSDNLWERIKEARYEERDLKKLIQLMNGRGSEDLAEEITPSRIRWFAGLGLQRSKLSFGANHHLGRRVIDRHSSLLPRISAGLDLFANPSIGKLFYRLEASYQISKSSTTSDILDDVKAVYSLSTSTVSLQSIVNYAVYNSSKLKIPVGFGFLYSRMSYPKNQYKKVYPNGEEGNYVEDWLDLKKSILTYAVRVSAVFHNKVEASFSYSPPSAYTKTPANTMSSNNMQFQVYYLFRKKK